MRILYNARVRTLNPAQPFVSALAVDAGRIAAAGEDQELLEAYPWAEREDLAGRTVWPGLTDAHLHMQFYGQALQQVDCETETRAECVWRVGERAKRTPPGQWLRGHGWNQNNWPEGFGTAADLDAAAPDVPVYLTAKSYHAGWVNSAALRAMGVNANTPDPAGGKIVRDAAGQPTGLLLENAMQLAVNAIPAPTPAQLVAALEHAQQTLLQMGITAVHDFDGSDCFAALQILQAQDRLRLRVLKGIRLEMLQHAAEVGLRSGFGNDFLRVGAIKLFADGALGPHTAAMLQPYEDEPNNNGMLLLDHEEILEHGQLAARHGLSLAIHAIGDRANHEVLLAYEQLRAFEQEQGLPRLRHRIEHVQVLHPQDYGRLAALDVIASVQPIHATSDMHMVDRSWGARGAGAYAFRTLIDHGTRVCFGSDAPVESPNPFLGLHAAVTRRRSDGSPAEEGWYPGQRLHLEEALRGFTSGAAYAAGLEHQAGTLAPGYHADLIVLPCDPFASAPQELYQVKPQATMVGGSWAWQEE